MLKVLDLFSGIGGFSLGLERAGGFKTGGFCEIDPLCQKVLSFHWPNIKLYKDIKSLNLEELKKDNVSVDIITGGFPCQPFSSAARGRNNAEDLWPEMARLASEIKPNFAIAENVQFEPIARAADFFYNLGKQVDVFCISGYAVGADTKRSRWWAVAHPYKSSELSSALNAEAQELPSLRGSLWGEENYLCSLRLSDRFPYKLGAGCFGNAVIPLIPEMIGRAIMRANRV